MLAENPTELASLFEGQAWWRREKAKEHPDDRRNLEAADLCDRLAQSALQCPQEIITKAFEAGMATDLEIEAVAPQATEIWSQMERDVGFRSNPKSAEAMLLSYIEKVEWLKEELAQESVSVD